MKWDPDDEFACGGSLPQPCAYCGERIAYFTDLSTANKYAKGWMHVESQRRFVNCHQNRGLTRAEPEAPRWRSDGPLCLLRGGSRVHCRRVDA